MIDNILSLITLSGLEIILGIDNVIFIALLIHNLPKEHQGKVRFIGLSFAFILRILLLFAASWIAGLHQPLIMHFSGQALLFIFGGLFLVIKSISEVKEMLHAKHDKPAPNTNSQIKQDKARGATPTNVGEPTSNEVMFKNESWYNIRNSLLGAIIQVMIIDLILSLDSVITAVGMTTNLTVIIIAILFAIVVMMLLSQSVGRLINSHPSIKVLGLNFILLLGVFLILTGCDIEINKAYLYFAMFFSSANETINILLKKKKDAAIPTSTHS